MSHRRKNSVRDKVIGKKWIYLERNTLYRVWAISEGKRGESSVFKFFIKTKILAHNCVS